MIDDYQLELANCSPQNDSLNDTPIHYGHGLITHSWESNSQKASCIKNILQLTNNNSNNNNNNNNNKTYKVLNYQYQHLNHKTT